MRTCLIILGMHRSGTSAISGFLNQLGLSLGSNLMLPDQYNERGYFENSYIVQANDNILKTLGSSWDDLFLLEEGWQNLPQLAPHREAVREIINREFNANELFCVKDPRISVLLPFWISVLQEMDIRIFFVIPLRHLMEVAESLKARDGFSIQKGLLLWMNNMLSLEYYSRPFERIFLAIDDFLKYPADTVWRILNKFNIIIPHAESQINAVAGEFLEPKLKHYNIETLNVPDDVLLMIDQLKTILFTLGDDADLNENDLIAVDKIREEYKTLNAMFYNQDVGNMRLALA
jgi:hypothetical protein